MPFLVELNLHVCLIHGTSHRLTHPPLLCSVENEDKVRALIDSQKRHHKRHPIHKRKGADGGPGTSADDTASELLALKDLYRRDSGTC